MNAPPAAAIEAKRPGFVFLGLGRDCADTLPGFLSLLDQLNAEGLAAFAIIGENGSRDGSRALLQAAEQAGKVKLVPTEFMSREPDRLRRMALGRERLKQALGMSGLQPRVVCVVDLDNVLARPPTVASLAGAAAKLDRPGVFGVSATSRPHYYDLLAFHDETRGFDTLLAELAQARGNILAYHRFFRARIYPHQQALTADHEIACTSTFNGLCLYTAERYRMGSYLEDGPSRCEHVAFNLGLADRTGARMLIDPDLVLATPDDHRQERFAPFAWRRLKKLLAGIRCRPDPASLSRPAR
ncbi:MAG: hypothetical protein DI527_01365 [Chelatococcus sp.]|nr:MAG: hypothetical protein DI527_01365 [Chelatococcus sp.]